MLGGHNINPRTRFGNWNHDNERRRNYLPVAYSVLPKSPPTVAAVWTMKICVTKHLLGWSIVGLLAIFHLIAGIGWLRERHDVRVNQERFRALEREFREKFDQIHEGDSLEKVIRLFPGSDRDMVSGSGKIEFIIRTGYEENSSCTNVKEKTAQLIIVAGKVARADVAGGGGKHMDRFSPPTPWYYFWRAWRSSVFQYDGPTPFTVEL